MSDKPPYRTRSLFPKKLGQCVDPITRPVFKSRGLAGTKLLGDWASIVGKELAVRSLPEKLAFPPGKKTGGTLTIAVQNGFAPQIQHMQAIILEKLATYYGYRAVERIQISHSFAKKQAPTATPTAKKPKAMSADILKHTESITDPELKAALESFGRTLSES